ncbi:MAG: ice-binding family protein [Candidatus Woesebacteria bacterium]
MNFFNVKKSASSLSLILILLYVLLPVMSLFIAVPTAYAATSPTLGQAASFAVLAGTAITNVPTSVITGDVGLSPASGSNYSGLTAAEVSGHIYAVDGAGPAGSVVNPALLTQAKADLVTAYDSLALGANSDANCDAAYQFGAGNKDLVGASLPPGVYCADTFTLTGTLTLTGTGVWVFRSAATLVTSGTANIVGGDPCNIWWQIPSSATLGTTTSLKGSILALTSITMNTGASLTGRALARNGAVSLASNTINQSCTASAVVASSGSSGSSSISTPGLSRAQAPAACIPNGNLVNTRPIVIGATRNDPTSITINWGPYQGFNRFIVEYGTTNGQWVYNTTVTGFSATLTMLPANQPIWVRVAATDNCAVGFYSEALLAGTRLPRAGNDPENTTQTSTIFFRFQRWLHSLSW